MVPGQGIRVTTSWDFDHGISGDFGWPFQYFKILGQFWRDVAYGFRLPDARWDPRPSNQLAAVPKCQGEFRAKIKEHSELIESYQPLGRCYGPREPYACPYQDRLAIPPGCFNVNTTMIIPRVNVWMITPHINELGVSKRPGLTQRLTFCERFFRAGLPPRLQRLVSKGCQEWPVFAVLPGGKHSDAGLLQ